MTEDNWLQRKYLYGWTTWPQGLFHCQCLSGYSRFATFRRELELDSKTRKIQWDNKASKHLKGETWLECKRHTNDGTRIPTLQLCIAIQSLVPSSFSWHSWSWLLCLSLKRKSTRINRSRWKVWFSCHIVNELLHWRRLLFGWTMTYEEKKKGNSKWWSEFRKL